MRETGSSGSWTALPTALTHALRAGLLAALGTWAVVVLPALVGWVSAPESSLGWFSAVSIGSAIWFLGHGQSIGGASIAISIAPVLLLLLFVVIARRGARRLLATERAEVRASEWGGVLARFVVPGFLVGYFVGSCVVAMLTLGGRVGPGPAAILGALIVPVAALGSLLLRPGAADSDERDPAHPVRQLLDRGPRWLLPAWRLGWRGAWLLLGLGLAVVLLRLLVLFPTVATVQAAYDLNLVSGLVLAIGQLGFLGNLATWGLAFVAGPGFSVAVGGAISPAGAHPGLMPLVPVLAGLPEEATYPWPMWLVVVLPVLAGAVIARWVDREGGDFPLRHRWLAAAGACVVAVVVVGAITALGNGGVGGERLSAVGPSLLPLVAALLLETLVGAAAFLGWRRWQARRLSRG